MTDTSTSHEATRALLRHVLATIAYRGAKATRGVPAGFSASSAGHGVRTPGQILAHVCDLFDWMASLLLGAQSWRDTEPADWDADLARFHDGLARVDELLVAADATAVDAERLLQGPLADALTHVGQIALLRRLADAPVRGENYFQAEIAAGRVGADQAPPRRELG